MNEQPKATETQPNKQEVEKKIEIGKIYRIAKQDIGGYRYSFDYDEGNFIHVRVLEGPDNYGKYTVTTKGEDGQHLGPGGGWHGESELHLTKYDLEEIQ